MGGKGDSHSTVAPVNKTEDNDSATMMMMYEMMMNQQAMQNAANRPQPLQMPEIQKSTDIDWSEQNKILAAKAKADYTMNQSKKKGIPDTIHTSPLLDEETTTNVASVLK